MARLKSNGDLSETTNQSKRLEAYKDKTYRKIAEYYDIYYRAYKILVVRLKRKWQ